MEAQQFETHRLCYLHNIHLIIQNMLAWTLGYTDVDTLTRKTAWNRSNWIFWVVPQVLLVIGLGFETAFTQ